MTPPKGLRFFKRYPKVLVITDNDYKKYTLFLFIYLRALS